jgi:hypothetical protein
VVLAKGVAVQETAVHDSSTSATGVPMHIDSYFANREQVLCQNCVTCPPKPRSNTVIYGDTPMHIVVAEVVDGECVGAYRCALLSVTGMNFQACANRPLRHLPL